MGDTTWALFHRLNREQAEQLLDHRARNGFNVVQAVAIAELEGHSDANPYGHLPLVDLDPSRPAVKDGPSNDYWDHVDFIVDAANRRGIYVGVLPTWGRFWRDTGNDRKPLFTPGNAEVYGDREINPGLICSHSRYCRGPRSAGWSGLEGWPFARARYARELRV